MHLYIIAGRQMAWVRRHSREHSFPNMRTAKTSSTLIEEGMSPFSPEAAAIRAGRLVLREIEFFSQRKVSFAFETTLSGRTYLRLITRLKEMGYKVHLFILFVERRRPTEDAGDYRMQTCFEIPTLQRTAACVPSPWPQAKEKPPKNQGIPYEVSVFSSRLAAGDDATTCVSASARWPAVPLRVHHPATIDL